MFLMVWLDPPSAPSAISSVYPQVPFRIQAERRHTSTAESFPTPLGSRIICLAKHTHTVTELEKSLLFTHTCKFTSVLAPALRFPRKLIGFHPFSRRPFPFSHLLNLISPYFSNTLLSSVSKRWKVFQNRVFFFFLRSLLHYLKSVCCRLHLTYTFTPKSIIFVIFSSC